MKKTFVFITFLISMCCMVVFAGCAFDNSVKSISFSSGETVVVELGKFDYDDYKIKVSYSSGKEEEIDLTEDMISSYDKLKFYQIGEQTITITYKNCSCKMKIDVKRAGLDNVAFEDKTVVYNGQSFAMEVEGDIPADVTIRYPNGNTFTNAGIYEVKAICYGDNYKTKELNATLTIKKAVYDMSNVEFGDAEFTYDRTAKSISVIGSLPTGVSVEYKIGDKKGNSEINAGEYEVVASFSSNNANYEQIPDKKAILKIKKAKYADFNISFNDKNTVYTGHSNSIEAELTSIPNGVSTYYTIQKIKNARGEDVSSPEENGNSATFAGTYVVRLNFKLSDSSNYENIESKKATLFIDRALYVIDDAFMYSDSVYYDKIEKSIVLSGEIKGTQPTLPVGVSVSYSIRLTKDALGNSVDEVAVSGNTAVNAGTYEVLAHLTSTDENYKEIKDIVGILEIKQAEYKNLNVSMNNLNVNFDGEEHSISVESSNLPETVTIKYTIRKTKNSDGTYIENPVSREGNSAIDTGTYEIIATFENSDKNYSEISTVTAVLVISEVE